MSKNKHNVVIVGCGSIGKRHARNLKACDVEAIYGIDPDPGRRAEMQAVTQAECFPDLGTALAKTTPNAAVIASPTAMHLQHALAAAKAGCHLFIEKPLSHTSEGLDELLGLMREKRLKGHIGSNWKFHPSFVLMKKILDERQIGKVLSARCQAGQYLPDWHPQEDYRKGYSARKALGGGILLDCHEFDYLTWFAGAPSQIACFADKVSPLEIETEDVAEVILRFKNGAVGEIHVDYFQRTYQRNFEFFGTDGSLFWDFNSKKVRLYLAGNKTWQEWPEPAGYDLNRMYLDQTKHVLDVLDGRAEPATPVQRGRDILSWISAARSSSQNQNVVTV